MPEEHYVWLPKEQLLTFSEIVLVVSAAYQLGVRSLRLTGGEPLLRKDLHRLIAMLKSECPDLEIALTTNASLLTEQAKKLWISGLDRVTVSLDSIDPKTAQKLNRAPVFDKVIQGIKTVAHSPGLKIDTVIIRDLNDNQLVELLDFAKSVSAEIRFIEYMDVGGATQWHKNLVVSESEILQKIHHNIGPTSPLPSSKEAPANRWQLDHNQQTFGIISSVTQPFCRDCDRLRMTADGSLFTCLYSRSGLSIRDLIRKEPEKVLPTLRGLWSQRQDQGAVKRSQTSNRKSYISLEELATNPTLEMHTKGG